MDPVSLAFAVIGISLQLVDTSVSIKAHIDAYKSAAKEIAILSDRLDDVETICQGLGATLGGHDDAPRPWNGPLLRKLHKNISRCQQVVSPLHNLVQKISAGDGKTRGSLNALGLRFLKHKGAISKYNDELDRALQSLQILMVTNMMASNYTASKELHQSRTVTTVNCNISKSRRTINVAQKTERQQAWNETTVQTKSWFQAWNSFFFFQYSKVQKTSKTHRSFSSPPLLLEETSSYLAASPLFGLYVKMAIQRGCLSPFSVSITFPYVVNLFGDDEIGARLHPILELDDATGLERLLNAGVVTPSMEVITSLSPEAPESLFTFAVMRELKSITELLLSRHFHPSERTIDKMGYVMLNASDMRCADAYISTRQHSLTEGEFATLWSRGCTIEYIHSLIASCRPYFSRDPKRFNELLWENIVQTFCSSPQWLIGALEWVDLVRDIVSGGFDVHRLTWRGDDMSPRGLTALEDVLCLSRTPEAAFQAVRSWTDLLEQCGIETEEYLDLEVKQCSSIWDEDGFSRWTTGKTFCVRQFDGKRYPCWSRTPCDSNLISELTLEFPHLLESCEPEKIYGCFLDELNDTFEPHRSWKMNRSGHADIFPFTWIPSRSLGEVVSLLLSINPSEHERIRRTVEGVLKACDLMDSRFERREMKKLRRACRLGALERRDQMPGAWID